MDDFKEKLIFLLHDPKITWTAVYQILKKDSALQNFHPLSRHSSVNPQFMKLHSEKVHEQIRQYKSNNITVITLFDKEYPTALKEIYQPPWALFAKGDVSLLEKETKLAVVGSREASEYGRNAIRTIFPGLIEKGVVIVSGLAKGIDALAHEFPIKNQGKTIAVIAGGFHHIYPKENIGLGIEMMKNQLVLSEYPPDTQPERWQFPARNRIISGLSKGTLIIEAKRKSGSLITANYAVNEGRDVFCVPGSIFNPNSTGTNDLIRQGAKLVMCAGDILEEISL